MDKQGIGYDALVNYAGFDMFKIACQQAGLATAGNLQRNGFQELPWTRGESAYVVKMPWGRGRYFAHVEEGLGTKNIPAQRMADAVAQQQVAEELRLLMGRSFFNQVSICNAAMILNDLITSGADPLSFMLHLAVGESDWFKDEQRYQDVIEGTKSACNMAGCSWGGGETPVLRNVIVPSSVLLSGSATGYISSFKRLINPANIRDGDAIILFESSGPHANGYTMLWDVVAPRLPEGYLAKVPGDGRTFGEAILAPTFIYAPMVQAVLEAGIRIHYAVNITGHGWAKLMRAMRSFTYVIDRLPKHQPLFDLIGEVNPIGKKKMYQTFNMGAGFAIYVSQQDAQRAQAILETMGTGALIAGHIERSKNKRVVIDPEGIEFGPEDLKIR